MIDLSRAGAVAQPDGEGRAGGGRCNDRVRFTLGLVGDRLEQVLMTQLWFQRWE